MITSPVFIIGAPRSGTSMLFHIIRTSQSFWSLPSEGFHIWNTVCHPSSNNWSSEECHDIAHISNETIKRIHLLYEQQSMPMWFWKYLINPNRIWKFSTSLSDKSIRILGGNIYLSSAKSIYQVNPMGKRINRRLIDKSLNNCLRLELVKCIFPEAIFIYLQRDGIASISSLINGWLNPHRFVTYLPPELINIEGYNEKAWKFVLPEGWREFNGHHLAELCTWQWKKCHEYILEFRNEHPDIFINVKMENLINNPSEELGRIADFIDVPFNNFESFLKNNLPRINETPSDYSNNFPFPEYLQFINKEIGPIMDVLGYERQ